MTENQDLEFIIDTRRESIAKAKGEAVSDSKKACIAVSCRPASAFARRIASKNADLEPILDDAIKILHEFESLQIPGYTRTRAKVGASFYLGAVSRKYMLTMGRAGQACGVSRISVARYSKAIRRSIQSLGKSL